MAEPKCVSFNVAANPDSNDFFLCELLDTDMFHDKGKLQNKASFHHFSPVSQHSLKLLCISWVSLFPKLKMAETGYIFYPTVTHRKQNAFFFFGKGSANWGMICDDLR